MREAGGSILSHKGENLTGRTYDAGTFVKYVNELCASDVDFVDGVLDTINLAIESGNNQVLLNEHSAQKCYSKPVVKLAIGCQVSFEMRARNGLEEDCSDGD
jgi:hypothetical protein